MARSQRSAYFLARARGMRDLLHRATSRSRLCDAAAPAGTSMPAGSRSLPRKLRRASPSPVTSRARASARTLPYSHEEFTAHTSNVTCVSLGHKSGRVLVTGGDDKKVNLWAVGKPHCIMSLGGHMTPIECVRFGHTEECVCAGSTSGALKIWDLEAARLVRTLTAHKNAARTVDFHPYGDFLASGSVDTNIKLWDTRRKGCIFTYKGHSQTVNSLKFSPDGQWIASAGEDGGVKIWDIRAGKMLTQFSRHAGAVLDVEFHPHEFLLASAGADRVVNFWDLENFQLVTSTDSQCGPIRCVSFSGDGECLLAGCHELLKVYGWEPFRSFDTVHVGWARVAALAQAQTQLVGAAFHSTNVSIFVLDMKKLQPYCKTQSGADTPAGGSTTTADDGRTAQVAPSSPAPFRHRQSIRKSFIKDKPPDMSAASVAMKNDDSSDAAANTDADEDEVSSSTTTAAAAASATCLVDVKNIHEYAAVFRPRNRTLCHSPPPPLAPISCESGGGGSSQVVATNESPRHQEQQQQPMSLPVCLAAPPVALSGGAADQQPRTAHGVCLSENTEVQQPACSSALPASSCSVPLSHCSQSQQTTTSTAKSTSQAVSCSLLSSTSTTTTIADCNEMGPSGRVVRHNPNDPVLPRSTALSSHASPSVAVMTDPSMLAVHHQPTQPPPDLVPAAAAAVAPLSPARYSPPSHIVPMCSQRPSGLAADDFLPKMSSLCLTSLHHNLPTASFPSSMSAGAVAASESDVLRHIADGHRSMMVVLSGRQRQLEISHAVWRTKDARTALEQLVDRGDTAVVVDLLAQLNFRPSIWNLDMCQVVLPCVPSLFESSYETYMNVGCATLALIVRNFAGMIKTNLASPVYTHGVDISREERYNKCKACHDELLVIRASLQKRQTLQGKIGRTFRELLIQMQSLD